MQFSCIVDFVYLKKFLKSPVANEFYVGYQLYPYGKRLQIAESEQSLTIISTFPIAATFPKVVAFI